MILGISSGRFSRRSEPGAGISARWIASAEASSKRREIKVLKALTRKARMMRMITKKVTVLRLIVNVRQAVGAKGGGSWVGLLRRESWQERAYKDIEEGEEKDGRMN